MGGGLSSVSTFSHSHNGFMLGPPRNAFGQVAPRGFRRSPVEISFSDNHGELIRKYKALELPGMDDEKFDGFDIGLDKKLRDLALLDSSVLVDAEKRLPGMSDLGQARQYRTDDSDPDINEITINDIYRMFDRASEILYTKGYLFTDEPSLESNIIISDLIMGSESLEMLGVEFLRMADWLSSSAVDLHDKRAKSKVNGSLAKSKVSESHHSFLKNRNKWFLKVASEVASKKAIELQPELGPKTVNIHME